MITIGIPTYNEESCIANSINSVLPQLSEEDEVIIVASGCTDSTVAEINKINDKRINLIIQKEREGKASALNLIIKNAKGEIIVQTDGDVELDKDAIQNLIAPFESNNKIGGVSGCPIPIIDEDNLFYNWTIMSYNKMHDIRVKESEAGTFWHLSGYLLAFRKEALKEVPFAKGAIDAWMGKIIKDNGWKLFYVPDAKVFVKTPLTIHDFIAQKARVRAGYAALPEMPRSVQGEIWSFPGELARINVGGWHKFFLCAIIYAWTWVKGFYMQRTNKSLKEIWKIPKSTK